MSKAKSVEPKRGEGDLEVNNNQGEKGGRRFEPIVFGHEWLAQILPRRDERTVSPAFEEFYMATKVGSRLALSSFAGETKPKVTW